MGMDARGPSLGGSPLGSVFAMPTACYDDSLVQCVLNDKDSANDARFLLGGPAVDREHPDDQQLQYVEQFAAFFATEGLARMSARVLALLTVSGTPGQSSRQLTGALGASKGSISTATRFLIQTSLIERFHVRGSRQDYFRLRPEAWSNFIRQRLDFVSGMREMADRGLSVAGLAAEARARLEELRDSYAFFEQELPSLVARWERERGSA